MMVKHHGRKRVHNVLAKAGHGVSGAAKVASGSRSDGIRNSLRSVGRELKAEGGAARERLDRKSRMKMPEGNPVHSGDPKVRKKAVIEAANRWN